MADIISDFPDSVLCYILSFLPTKQVVTTSVLSKRWNLLWRSVPSFDFDLQGGIDDDKEFCSRFFQSLCSFLLFRDKRQLFHRFRLKCFCFCNHSGERIIEAETIKVALLKSAMKKNGRLEHLDLNLYWRLWVPSPVFRCKTLVVLKLANLTLKDVPFVDLPLLKILHLNYVYFEQDDLPQFLSGTPNLEDLLVNNMTANSAEKFHRLPNLVRANIHEHLVPLDVVKNVEVLFTDRIDLKDLVFDLHNLVQLELTLVYCKELVEVLEVLKHCPKLQTLVISTYDDKVCDSYDDECGDVEAVLPYPNSVPSCISLQLKTCCIGNCRGSLVEIQFGKYILQNAKYLRNMNFWFSRYNCAYFGPLRRHNMIRDLSSCIKSSDTCTLSFK